jgi:hypothetical protein
MVGFRTRFFFLLIVYFAGFATAVYVLSPTPEAGNSDTMQAENFKSVLNSGQFTEAINTGMLKCVGLGKEIAGRASVLIKEKLEEMQAKQAAGDHS